MEPEIGKTYEIRIPRAEGYEYLGEQRTEADCIGKLLDGYWTFGIALPHAGDEGRGVGFAVHERDILSEAL
jgi:hypothetical protein